MVQALRSRLAAILRAPAVDMVEYESVQRALAQRVFSSRTKIMVETDAVLLGNDPPAHTAVRRLLARHFSKEAVARRAALAEETAERLLEPLRAGDPIDAIAGFVTPLAQAIAADLVGIPADVLHRLGEMTRRIGGHAVGLRHVDERSRKPQHAAACTGMLDDGAARWTSRGAPVCPPALGHRNTPKRVMGFSAILLLLEHPAIRSGWGGPTELASGLRRRDHPLVPGASDPGVTTARRCARRDDPTGRATCCCRGGRQSGPVRLHGPGGDPSRGETHRHLSFGAVSPVYRRITGARRHPTGCALSVRSAPRFRAAQPLSTVRYAPGGDVRESEQW